MKLTANKNPKMRAPNWTECCSALSAEQRAAKRLLQRVMKSETPQGDLTAQSPMSELFAAARKKLSEKQRAILRAIRPALWDELNRRAWGRAETALQKKLGRKPNGDDLYHLEKTHPEISIAITAADYDKTLSEWQTGGEFLRAQYEFLLCIPATETAPPVQAGRESFPAMLTQKTRDIERRFGAEKMDNLFADLVRQSQTENGVISFARENFGGLDSIGYKPRKLAIAAIAAFGEKHKTPDAARKFAIKQLRDMQAKDENLTAADIHVYAELPLSEFMRRAGFSHPSQIWNATKELTCRAIPYSALRTYKKGGKTIRAAALGSATFKAILMQGENKLSPANRKQTAPKKAITVRIGIPAEFVMHPRYVFFLPDGVRWADILPALRCDGDISLFMHLTEKLQRGDGGRADITDDDLRLCYAADIAAAQKRNKGGLTAARPRAERLADELRACGALTSARKSTGAEWQIACTSDIAHARRLSAK